ncbi:MAG: efflux RND transporter periplasmic adaptor subunit [Planctomycetota bacterium]
MKKLLLAITIIVAAIVLFSGCRKKASEQSAKSQKVPAVKVIAAIEGSISKTLELTGSVTATKVARMGSPAEGPIMQCQVREGDNVTAGQVLLTIGRKKAADALVQAAQDSLTREQEELKRITKLVDSGAIAAEELETANLKVSRARAELSKALESVEDYQIEAPWDGVVSKVFITDGYYVAPRESLVEIYDPTSTVIEFAIPESQAAIVHKGMLVEVELDAYPGQQLKGEITRIYPELNRQTRTRTAEAVIIYNDGISLLPGMFTRIRLVLETVKDAVLIPDKAIVLNTKNEPTAFVIIEEKAEARKLKLGLEKKLMVQIVEGIKPGEMVVVEGNEKLKKGAAVKVIGGESKKEKADSGDKK